MGSGIAYVFALHEYRVEIVDSSPAGRDRCRATIERVTHRAVEQGRVVAPEAEELGARVRICGSLQDVDGAPELLIEAVPEDLELKRRVLIEAEQCRPGLLATNTSSISINELSTGLSSPESFLGLHFFNPVWSNPLLEIVTGDATAESAVQAAQSIAVAISKEVVLVRDSPGFASSRLGVALGLEAIRMVEEGVATPEDIDRAMEIGYRHPMGPLRLTDLVGLDVRLGIATNLERAFGARFTPPQILIDKVNRGELGKKSGRGFFNW